MDRVEAGLLCKAVDLHNARLITAEHMRVAVGRNGADRCFMTVCQKIGPVDPCPVKEAGIIGIPVPDREHAFIQPAFPEIKIREIAPGQKALPADFHNVYKVRNSVLGKVAVFCSPQGEQLFGNTFFRC